MSIEYSACDKIDLNTFSQRKDMSTNARALKSGFANEMKEKVGQSKNDFLCGYFYR